MFSDKTKTENNVNILGAEFLPEGIHKGSIGNLLDHVQDFSHKLLLDDLKQFVLLKGFTGDIQRQIIRVNNTLDKSKIFWHHVFKVFCDEHSTNVQLDVFSPLTIILEGTSRGSFWYEEN